MRRYLEVSSQQKHRDEEGEHCILMQKWGVGNTRKQKRCQEVAERAGRGAFSQVMGKLCPLSLGPVARAVESH